jgi:DNA-binding HxlR family transcriptional regulator
MNTIICDFSSSLSDIPAKQRRNSMFVLQVLKHNPRFSCFEAAEHQLLAKTLDLLRERGLIERPQPQPQYPWIEVRVTSMGDEWMAREGRS